jgi:hypothetical protein
MLNLTKKGISTITNPKEMWDKLAEQLSSAFSFGRRVTIGKNFDNARPKTGESISAYLSRLNNMQVQLAGTEGAISDEKFLYHIYLTVLHWGCCGQRQCEDG